MVFASAVLLVGVVQHDPQPVVDDPRVLYLRTAELLAAPPGPLAVEVLDELVQRHAQTYYAELAAFHLAECYVILGESLRAVELLEKWRDRLRFPLEETVALAPDLYPRAQALHTMAARTVASEYELCNDFRSAVVFLEKARLSAETSDLQMLQQEIVRTAVAGCMHEVKQSSEVETLLSGISEEWQLPIRFALAEKCIAAGWIHAAEDQLAWLSAKADKDQARRSLAVNDQDIQSSSDKSPLAQASPSAVVRGLEGSDYPAWAFTVALRRCELAVRQKQLVKAKKLIGEAKEQYSKSAQSYEFDFLLTRCAVAQVEFDEAIRMLRDISTRQGVPVTMRAKANWMMGELYFLKQEPAPAIAAYRQVLEIDAPDWQSRALLQMAKCQELIGQTAAAVRSYERLQTQFGQTSDAEYASARIAQLRTLIDTSGKLQQPQAK